jgi:hypothetical protein
VGKKRPQNQKGRSPWLNPADVRGIKPEGQKKKNFFFFFVGRRRLCGASQGRVRSKNEKNNIFFNF